MTKGLLSVIIPSRNEQFLQKTVDDLLSKAEEAVEIVIVMDGVWQENFDWNKKNIVVIHHGTFRDSFGMRPSINAGMAVANGEFVMKLDGHCMIEKGFDVKLKADCEDNWVMIPRRHRLDPDKWEIADGGKPPVDYMAIDYPYKIPFHHANGLHGHIWNQRYHERKDILIDDTPSFQGSCYFCTRKHWDKTIIRLEDENYGPFSSEAQEIGFKTLFSGGEVKVNKKTWYAHLHKGKRFGRGFAFSNTQYKKHLDEIQKGQKYCMDYWLNTKDYKYDFEWFINKFPNMPNWEKDWKKQMARDKKTLNG